MIGERGGAVQELKRGVCGGALQSKVDLSGAFLPEAVVDGISGSQLKSQPLGLELQEGLGVGFRYVAPGHP